MLARSNLFLRGVLLAGILGALGACSVETDRGEPRAAARARVQRGESEDQAGSSGSDGTSGSTSSTPSATDDPTKEKKQ